MDICDVVGKDELDYGMNGLKRTGRLKRGGKQRLLGALSRLINYDLFEHMQWARPSSAQDSESSAVALIVAPTVRAQTLARVSQPVRKPAVSPSELPDVAELYRLFDLYNAIHFDNALPSASIEYSTRMLAAGSCEPVRRRIKIGVRYHQIFREEIEDTLKHEMIHLIHFKHDKRFKAKAAELGVSVHAKFHPDLKRPPRYLYQCPTCRTQYPRQKRLRETSCGLCSRGGFDRRHKLALVDSAVIAAKACR